MTIASLIQARGSNGSERKRRESKKERKASLRERERERERDLEFTGVNELTVRVNLFKMLVTK